MTYRDTVHTDTYTNPDTGVEYKVTYWLDHQQGPPDHEFDSHGHILTLDFDPTDPYEVQERMDAGHSLIGEEFAMRAPLMRNITPYRRLKKQGLWYDYVTSLNVAVKEWGVSPENAVQAVEQDFKYIYGWYNDEWYWIGITVQRADEDDPWHDTTHSVGGYESLLFDDATGRNEVLAELVYSLESEIHHEFHKDQLCLPLDTAAVIHLTNYR